MDLDAYAVTHQDDWAQLEALTKMSRRNGAQTDTLVTLYQRVSVQLSYVQANFPDTKVAVRLSGLVNRARIAIQGPPHASLATVREFFVLRLPAAIYVNWRYHVCAALLTVAIAWGFALYLIAEPSRVNDFISPDQAAALAQRDFVQYYFDDPQVTFFSRVWVNNTFVTALALAFGITGGLTLMVLWNNAVNVGLSAGVMHIYGADADFWGYILPHGLLELTCVFMALGGGFAIFMAWVKPGPEKRSTAVARQGRATLSLVLGLAVVLFFAGLLEGFMTPSGAPTAVRIGVGALVWTAFLTYVALLGRRAVSQGYTGDVTWEDSGFVAAAAD